MLVDRKTPTPVEINAVLASARVARAEYLKHGLMTFGRWVSQKIKSAMPVTTGARA